MSVFAANDKYLALAQMHMNNAKLLADEQADVNFGRDLLANIRQLRIQKAALDLNDLTTEGIYSSGMQNATQFLHQQSAEPVARAFEDTGRAEEIQTLQHHANRALKKYKKQAKTARTTGYISAALLAVAGGFLGAAAVSAGAAAAGGVASTAALTGGAIGGGLVGGGVSMGGGSIAGADRNFYSGAIRGTMTGTAIAGTAASAGLIGPSSSALTAGETTVMEGAAGSSSFASIGGTDVVTSSSFLGNLSNMTGSQWIATGSILKTIGGAVKDINGYQVKVPVSTSYVGNYSNYVNSFRGFA